MPERTNFARWLLTTVAILRPVTGLDLRDVLEDRDELDAVGRGRRGERVEVAERRDVGSLVEHHEKSRSKRRAGGRRLRKGPFQHLTQQGHEDGRQSLLLVRRGDDEQTVAQPPSSSVAGSISLRSIDAAMIGSANAASTVSVVVYTEESWRSSREKLASAARHASALPAVSSTTSTSSRSAVSTQRTTSAIVAPLVAAANSSGASSFSAVAYQNAPSSRPLGRCRRAPERAGPRPPSRRRPRLPASRERRPRRLARDAACDAERVEDLDVAEALAATIDRRPQQVGLDARGEHRGPPTRATLGSPASSSCPTGWGRARAANGRPLRLRADQRLEPRSAASAASGAAADDKLCAASAGLRPRRSGAGGAPRDGAATTVTPTANGGEDQNERARSSGSAAAGQARTRPAQDERSGVVRVVQQPDQEFGCIGERERGDPVSFEPAAERARGPHRERAQMQIEADDREHETLERVALGCREHGCADGAVRDCAGSRHVAEESLVGVDEELFGSAEAVLDEKRSGSRRATGDTAPQARHEIALLPPRDRARHG